MIGVFPSTNQKFVFTEELSSTLWLETDRDDQDSFLEQNISVEGFEVFCS